jgi:heparanase
LKQTLRSMFLIMMMGAFTVHTICAAAQSTTLEPAKMARVGTVDERFQSYNVEMLEVTGGKFWKPYNSAKAVATAKPDASVPAGMDPNMYEFRAPLDLSNARLRKLAAALGPAYVRVSGTWANTTFFQGSAGPAATTPAGFGGELTQPEWKGVIDFAKAADAEIVTSFAIGAGVRDATGAWTPAQASKFLSYTRAMGGHIAAAEFMNEPTAASMGGAPKGYDATAYARDVAVFRPFLKKMSPETIFLGPGGVGEGGSMPLPAAMGALLSTQAILEATGPAFDALSYHYYGGVSSRCAAMAAGAVAKESAALSDEWLSRTGKVEEFYAGLRDQYLPGKPMWVTETADAACGGSRWASTFVDTFRYLNQLGTLARRGVQVVMHNTLDASDYGLLDERDYTPRPKYWGALLWHRLMGTTVLQPGDSPSPDLHLYAHCLRGVPGGVALLAINAGGSAVSLAMPVASAKYVLSAHELESADVELTGKKLELGANDELPPMPGVSVAAGPIAFAPQTISFLAVPAAGNEACRR